jgi:hypothetical protein
MASIEAIRSGVIGKSRKPLSGFWLVAAFSAIGLAACIAFAIVLQHFDQMTVLM